MKNFIKVWLVSGIFWGLGMGLLDAVAYDQAIIINLLSGLLSGIIAGAIFGLIASFKFRFEEITVLDHLSTAILLPMIGIILGIVFLVLFDKLPHGKWEQIKSPPEKAVRFLESSEFTFWGRSIVILSENGNYFSYSCDDETPCEWIQQESLSNKPADNPWSCPSDYTRSYPAPAMFKKIIDTYEMTICGVDYDIQINLNLLDDGTIWIWSKFSSFMQLLSRVPFVLIVGAVSGFLGYISLLFKKRKR